MDINNPKKVIRPLSKKFDRILMVLFNHQNLIKKQVTFFSGVIYGSGVFLTSKIRARKIADIYFSRVLKYHPESKTLPSKISFSIFLNG